jgi:hypothetical protein
LEAQAVAGAIAVPLKVAGARIDLVFAGTRLLVEFMPLLRHLEAAPTAMPEATFHVWDGHTTGVRIPLLQPDGVGTDEPVEPGRGGRSRYRAEIHAVDGPSSAIDMRQGQAVYWVQSAERLVPSNLDLPMHALFRWALERSHGGTLPVAAIRAALARRDEASVAAVVKVVRSASSDPH